MADDQRQQWRRAMALFERLRDLDPGQRRSRLDQAAEEPGVIEKLEALWRGRATADPLLDLEPGALLLHASEANASALSGRRIGAYQLNEEIGRGGMSVVYRAHRADGQFEREVAVKILTLGQLAQGSADRLRHERTVLARLSHPGIATLLDGGVSTDGTPWLATELVDGRPVDEYCERARLDSRQCVRLMLQVCEAVEYAHHNLIVHRDLKPSNILVDGNGWPRVLDFGIAKLLDEAGEDNTSTRVLTPGYGAPEQREGGAVTTATDVYGLGAVLFRMLVGRPPPADTAPTPPAALERDLALIVAQALRTEPERRYPTAGDLAADLERWLANLPVRAAPDSLRYRAGKFLQRRRGTVGAAAIVILAIAAGVGGTLWQAGQARQQAELAGAQNRFLLDLFESADVMQSGGAEPSVAALLEEASSRAEERLGEQDRIRAALLRVIGVAQRELGHLASSRNSLERALAAAERAGERREAVLIRRALAVQAYEEGDLERAVAGLEEALRELQEQAPARDPELLRTRLDYANLLVEAKRPGEALAQLDSLPDRYPDDERGRELFEESLRSRGMARDELGQPGRAVTLLGRAVELHRAHAGPRDPTLAAFLNDYALALIRAGRLTEAAAALEESLAGLEALLGLAHPRTLATLNNLAYVHREVGNPATAVAMARRAVEGNVALYGESHQLTGEARVMLATILASAGDPTGSRRELKRGIDILESAAPGTLSHANALSIQAGALADAGEYGMAVDAAARAQPLLERTVGAEHFRSLLNRVRWARALSALDRASEALERLAGVRPAIEADLGATSPLAVEARLVGARALSLDGRPDRALAELAPLSESSLEPDQQARLDGLCAELGCNGGGGPH